MKVFYENFTRCLISQKKQCVCVCVRRALNVYFNIQKYCMLEEKQTNVPNYGSLYSSTRALKQVGLDTALCVSEWMRAR